MSNRVEFKGDISSVQGIEDLIRSMKRKYTEGILTRKNNHPVQGESASRSFCKYYEFFPYTEYEVGWDMDIKELWSLVRDGSCIRITFYYDYRCDVAKVRIHGGQKELSELKRCIPNFADAITQMMIDPIGGNNVREVAHAV